MEVLDVQLPPAADPGREAVSQEEVVVVWEFQIGRVVKEFQPEDADPEDGVSWLQVYAFMWVTGSLQSRRSCTR